MSTQYPILYDRPINKWKVAELKEELKRRNLMIKGLKDDLVRRLDEAIRNERANFGSDVNNDFELSNKSLKEPGNPILQPHSGLISGVTENNSVNDVKVHNFVGEVSIVDETGEVDQAKATYGSVSVVEYIEPGNFDNAVDSSNKKDELVSSSIGFSEGPDGVLGNCGAAKESEILTSMHKDDMENEGNLEASGQSSGILNEVVDTEMAPLSTDEKNDSVETGNEDLEVVPIANREKILDGFGVKSENDCLKPPEIDAESHVSHSSIQVPVISPNLGFQVESESIKITDTSSNFEKNEIKENVIANNIELEPEVIRPQPSSSKDPTGDGNFHSLDNLVPDVKQCFVVEADDEKSIVKNSEKIDNADKVSAMEHILENRTKDEVADANELTDEPSIEKIDGVDVSGPNLPTINVGDDNELTEEPSIEKIDGVDVPGLNLLTKKVESCYEEKIEIAASAEHLETQDVPSSDSKCIEMTGIIDGEPLEKINLDQSSGDDSMEDESLEARQADFDSEPKRIGDETKPIKETGSKSATDIVTFPAEIPSNTLESSHQSSDRMAESAQKRKFEVEAAPDNKEPRKRQRRWNSEYVKDSEPQIADISLSSTSTSVLQTASTTPVVDLSNSAIDRDTTDERTVPPSTKAPTNSLRINNFVRPFTLKAVQELLSKTGTICNFWMDHIKTHCYVTFASIDEATETRNAVYNLQWPPVPYGGRLLIAEFVDPEEVKSHLEAPSQSAAPVNLTPAMPSQPPPPVKQLTPANQQDVRQITQPPRSEQQTASAPSTTRERLVRARSPSPATVDPPIVTLDDLFRKTRATPRIYYLPLTDEQVAAKRTRRRN